MTKSNRWRTRIFIWILWIFSMILSGAIAGVIWCSLLEPSGTNSLYTKTATHAPLIAHALYGLIAGFFQWLILRQHLRISIRWILFTCIGQFFGWLINYISPFLLFLLFPPSLELGYYSMLIFSGTCAGVCMGSLQFIVLRRYFRGAWMWLIISGVSWVVAGFVEFYTDTALFYSDMLSIWSSDMDSYYIPIAPLSVGVLSGLGMLWLLMKKRSVPLHTSSVTTSSAGIQDQMVGSWRIILMLVMLVVDKYQWASAIVIAAIGSCILLTDQMLGLGYKQDTIYYITANLQLIAAIWILGSILQVVFLHASGRKSLASRWQITWLTGGILGVIFSVILAFLVPFVSSLVSWGDILHTGLDIGGYSFIAMIVAVFLLLYVATGLDFIGRLLSSIR